MKIVGLAGSRGMRSCGGAVLLVAPVVDSVGNGLFQPLSVQFFARLTTVPLALIDILLNAPNALALPILLIVGRVADRIGPWVLGGRPPATRIAATT